MFALNDSCRFYLYNKAADMRKSFSGLSGLVRNGLKRNPVSGEAFIFINKRRNMMKILQWQQGGFMLYYKRLEQGTFDIPETKNGRLTYARLAMLTEGLKASKISQKKRYKKTQN